MAVAVSGGGDSVALLFLLLELREALGATLRVVHFNHRLRPNDADEDEQFVRKLADQCGLSCAVRAEDVRARSLRDGTNLEAEARTRRYAFFYELVSRGWATRVATAHTADDQAETVLARLARGSGPGGLRAIHPELGPVVRPLLGMRRQELRNYLVARGQPWREDATNWDASRQRARIRQGLLPLWEAQFGPSSVENLARVAELARNDEALIEELVEERFRSLARREAEDWALDARDILDPHPELKTAPARMALSSRLVRRLAREVTQDKLALTADQVAGVLELARAGTSGSRIDLPRGLVVERVLNRMVFSSRATGARIPRRMLSYSYWADPWQTGEAVVEIAETGKRLRLKLIDWPATGSETDWDGLGALDADRLELPLLVRNRLPGDCYRPRGRRHAEKVKRLLIERRVSSKDRARYPVLTSAGRVVWSSGLPVAADFAAGKETSRALVICEESNEPGQRIDSLRPERSAEHLTGKADNGPAANEALASRRGRN